MELDWTPEASLASGSYTLGRSTLLGLGKTPVSLSSTAHPGIDGGGFGDEGALAVTLYFKETA